MTGPRRKAGEVLDVETVPAPVKAVSVSHELTTIERAVQGAATLIEIGRQGGLEGEDVGGFASAILALVACRIRDLGRAGRGTLPVEQFWGPHSAAVDNSDLEDLVLYPASSRSSRGN